MPSPFHQKYSSQSNKLFQDSTVPAVPEAPKETERRGSDASASSPPSSPIDARRRSSQSSGQRFANLQALKRPEDEHHINRRASLQDSYGKVGFFGNLWNTYTRGPSGPAPPKEPRDTTTLQR